MTPKLYEKKKNDILAKQNPAVRGYINTYFEWLKSIKPEDVVDGLMRGTTAQQAYRQLGANPIRLGIGLARGFLKVAPVYREKLKEVMSLDLAMTTLKFENPITYQILVESGTKGREYVVKWIEGAKEILGVVPPPKKKEEK